MAIKQTKVNYRSDEYANESQKTRSVNLQKYNLKSNLLTGEILSEIVKNLEELKVIFGDEKVVSKTASYSQITLQFKDKVYKPILKIEDASYMKYHEKFGNGCLMLRTDKEYEKNVYKLLEYILTKMKEHFKDVKDHYSGINPKFNTFKVALPSHKTKDAKKKILFDFRVMNDKTDVKNIVIDPIWEDDESDKTGVKQLMEIFDGKSQLNTFVSLD